MKKWLFALAMCPTLSFGQPTIVTTTETMPWQIGEPLAPVRNRMASAIVVDTQTTYQTIEGFGGCFNELGWTSLSALADADRQAILKELFAKGIGANFTICRMPVGANDFSLDWYSYNENEGDFGMKKFSVANDKKTLIPFIKAAQQYAPTLKIWASPWSPPTWMKWNKHYACAVPPAQLDAKYNNHLPADRQGREGTNMFIQQEAYFKAYAKYFSKFIDAYQKEGVRIAMVMPQNEFNSCQIFPSCTWTAQGLATFVGKYLGPAMEKKGVEVMFGTMERPAEALVDTILNDPFSGKYVKGVGFQWAGKEAIPGIYHRYPNLKLYQTEQECGDGKNNWQYCTYAWSLMKHYLSNGVSSYLYWNISLAEGGVSRWGWSQNSLVTVNTEAKSFRYNHEFYLLKHFSHYVMPGAKRVANTGGYSDALAFQNPDQSVVIVIFNDRNEEQIMNISIKNKVYQAVLPASSFSTIVAP